jgi:hypothetical protein
MFLGKLDEPVLSVNVKHHLIAINLHGTRKGRTNLCKDFQPEV